MRCRSLFLVATFSGAFLSSAISPTVAAAESPGAKQPSSPTSADDGSTTIPVTPTPVDLNATLGYTTHLTTDAKPFFEERELITPELRAVVAKQSSQRAQADVWLSHGLPQEALNLTDSLLQNPGLGPEDRGWTWRLRARILIECGLYREAQQSLEIGNRLLGKTPEKWLAKLTAQQDQAAAQIVPLETALAKDPRDADRWAALAEAWADELLFCRRNALRAAAAALALNPRHPVARKIEAKVLADYLLATQGKRFGLLAEESMADMFFRGTQFIPADLLKRGLARLADEPETSPIYWTLLIHELREAGPAKQSNLAGKYAARLDALLKTNPELEAASIAVRAYQAKTYDEWGEVKDALTDRPGAEYFFFERGAALNARVELNGLTATKPDDQTEALQNLADLKNSLVQPYGKYADERKTNANWAVLRCFAAQMQAQAVGLAAHPPVKVRAAIEGLAQPFGQAHEDPEALLCAARLYDAFACAYAAQAQAENTATASDCGAKAVEYFRAARAHTTLPYPDMLAMAYALKRLGAADEARSVAQDLTEHDAVYGLSDPENRAKSVEAWLRAGLLHLSVTSDAEQAEQAATRCFTKAEALAGGSRNDGTQEQRLVHRASCIVGKFNAGESAKSLFENGPRFEGLGAELYYRLANRFLVSTVREMFAMAASDSGRAGFYSPLADPRGYEADGIYPNLIAIEAGAARGATWIDTLAVLEKQLEQLFKISQIAVALADGKINEQMRRRNAANWALVSQLKVERQAFITTANKINRALAAGMAQSEIGRKCLPDWLIVLQKTFSLFDVVGANRNPLPPAEIRESWRSFEVALGLRYLETAAESFAHWSRDKDELRKIADYVAKIDPARRDAAAALLRKGDERVVARSKAPAPTQDKEIPGVIRGLDFRVTPPKPAPRYTQPQETAPADQSRICTTCGGTGTVYTVTSYSNRAPEKCWRCKGKKRLQPWE